MAQYDLILVQNTAAAGIEYSEKIVNIAKGGIVTADTSQIPTVLAVGADTYILVADSTQASGLKWQAQAAGHTQNTDTGTTSSTFDIDYDGGEGVSVRLKAVTGALQVRDLNDAANADLTAANISASGNLTVTGDLTINGTTTTIDTATVQVEDKNIEIGKVTTPTDTTADGGGITLLGATNKTIIWDATNGNWTLNQDVNIPAGKQYKINNTALSASDVGAMASWGTAPTLATDAGTAGDIAYDSNYLYVCITTGAAGSAKWIRTLMNTNWV